MRARFSLAPYSKLCCAAMQGLSSSSILVFYWLTQHLCLIAMAVLALELIKAYQSLQKLTEADQSLLCSYIAKHKVSTAPVQSL